jgi:hypothetical protein
MQKTLEQAGISFIDENGGGPGVRLRKLHAAKKRKSSVSLRTIRRAELAERHTTMTAANDLAVRRALESAGVEFIDENGGGPGLRLRKAHQHGKRK